MNITLRQLTILSAVGKHLSMSKASEFLHLSQPAVSMQINQLEEIIGEPLIEIKNKKIYFTELGERILVHANHVLQQMEELKLDAQPSGELQGTLRISIPTTVQRLGLKLIGKFHQLHPRIKLEIDVNNRDGQLSKLNENQVELCIMGKPPSGKKFVGEPFYQFKFAMIAASSHPLKKRKKIKIQQLKNERLIFGEKGSPTRTLMEKYFSASSENAIEIDNNEAIKTAVSLNMGIAVLPSLVLEPQLKNHEIVILDVEHFPVKDSLYIVSLKGKRFTRVANEFKQFLLNHTHKTTTR